MGTPVLQLHLNVAEGREHECADFLARELQPAHFRVLCQLAAELVARWETRTGARVLVVPAQDSEQEVEKALRLRVAGPGLAQR